MMFLLLTFSLKETRAKVILTCMRKVAINQAMPETDLFQHLHYYLLAKL
jgi:hypothetical protein